jgi:hypothetical protein
VVVVEIEKCGHTPLLPDMGQCCYQPLVSVARIGSWEEGEGGHAPAPQRLLVQNSQTKLTTTLRNDNLHIGNIITTAGVQPSKQNADSF